MFNRIVSAFFALLILASASYASIVDANSRMGRLDFGLGTGILYSGGNIEYGMSDSMSLGVDFVTADLTLAGGWMLMLIDKQDKMTGNFYDAHINYQIIEGNDNQPFNVSLLGGVGQYIVKVAEETQDSRTMMVGGVCISSPLFFDNLIGRLNLVAGPPLGVEIAWKISDRFELNLGASAIGVIGAKLSI